MNRRVKTDTHAAAPEGCGELTEGQTLSVAAAIVKEGKSSPPQHFTEDTLLSAMETAGKEDMPEDAAVSYTHLDVYKRQGQAA